MTRSTQSKQWLLDRRKEEFRELVTAMTNATIELQTFMAARGTEHELSWSPWLDAHKLACRILADRIYIAEDLAKANIPFRYLEAAEKLRESGDPEHSSTDEISALIDEIVKLANQKHNTTR